MREGKSKRVEKYGTKKRKERREEPLGTMSYQTSSKRSPPFWLLIGARKTQVFKFPFFTFLRAIFFRPFRLSLAPTFCPWVSEDEFELVTSSEEKGFFLVVPSPSLQVMTFPLQYLKITKYRNDIYRKALKLCN